LTVPVAVIGTFVFFPLLGFSINITSMFGLVLAIGIVVDDAIVVVEAVQRHIDDGMSPASATARAMEEVSGPVVAIAFILAAVFIPVAFIGGISGEIYKQFAITIAVSVLLSAFNALSLSPALAALLLKPHKESKSWLRRPFEWFNTAFTATTNKYLSGVIFLMRRAAVAVLLMLAVTLVTGGIFKRLPTGFLPSEDQGAFFASIRLPDGATTDRTNAACARIEQAVGKIKGVDKFFVLGGLDIATGTSNSNVATIIATLTPWDERTTDDVQLPAILANAQRAFATVPDAFGFAFGLPPILGLAPTGGFQFMLEDRAGSDIATLARAADTVVAEARKRPELANVISTFRASVPSYTVDMNTDKLQTLGVSLGDAYNTLQTFLGGLYVNDFNQFGHTWQVLLQAQPEFRRQPSDIGRFYVRNSQNDMVPLSTLATIEPTGGPDVIYRYNRFRAIQILGGPAPGYSTGQASAAMEQVAASLPAGFGFEWTGTTYQEKQAQGNEGAIFGFAAVLVFLFLAALYESWSIPFAVLLALPLGMFGALLATYLRSYAYDIYTQIGIVTLIGLAAKNAILIVEFAKDSHEHGKSIRDAAIEAAHLRLRPILMTSFAFIFGVFPLVVATGASSAARRSLGTVVFGGMITATMLAVFIVPVLYVIIESWVERRAPETGGEPTPEVAR
jgi:multidrug efflux pump